MTWLVIMCARCGYPRVVRATQKTYMCFNCNYHGKVEQAKVVYRASKPQHAARVVAALKEKIIKGEIRVVYDTSRVRGRWKFRGWFRKRHPESTRPQWFIDEERYELVA